MVAALLSLGPLLGWCFAATADGASAAARATSCRSASTLLPGDGGPNKAPCRDSFSSRSTAWTAVGGRAAEIDFEAGDSSFAVRRSCSSSDLSSSPWHASSLPPPPARMCSSAAGASLARLGSPSGVARTLARGAFLRIASDLTGGTPFESVKTRVTTTAEGPLEAYRNIVSADSGVLALWAGTPSRMVEGALVGAVFMLASSLTKSRLRTLGAPPTAAALAGGLVGGVAQAVVMTPAGMIFTSLNYSRSNGSGSRGRKRPGQEPETAWSVASRIVREEGVGGLYAGSGPMCLRQASNWASRAGLTEAARTALGLSRLGVAGEVASGVVGGLGSCWNTPIESVRILSQRDVSLGRPPKSISGYWSEMIESEGYPGLFRGVTPRALQSIWQTIFMVVVPNLMGI